MAKQKAFEEMESGEMYGHMMDNSADMVKNSKDLAIRLLESAQEDEDRAEKKRHMAAVLILEAQNYAAEIGEYISMEFRTDLLPDSLTGEEETTEEEEDE